MGIERLQSRMLSVLVAIVLSLQLCFAQGSGNASLDVIVRDPSGALVNKAQVQLTTNGRILATAQTNQKGEARFSKISPGRYQIHVEAVGFKPLDSELPVLTPGSNRIEIPLEIDVIKV